MKIRRFILLLVVPLLGFVGAACTPAEIAAYLAANPPSAHHMDPLLVCIRTHESGGRYTLVNPPYSSAYEFLSSTWISMAHSAGIPNPPKIAAYASEKMQDDVAYWGLHHNPHAWTTYRRCT